MLARKNFFAPRTLFPAVLSLAFVALTSCAHLQREKGSQESDDQHVYVSYPWEPKTVSLLDTTTDEIIWSYEVPVGQKLVIKFENHAKRHSGQSMTWGVGNPDEGKIKLVNEMPVPSYQIRKLSWTIRPIPEYASSEADGSEGG